MRCIISLKGCADLMFFKFIRWAPRILSLYLIMLLLAFSLDVFDGGAWYLVLLGFLIHNIPTILLIILSIFSWRRSLFGAISFFAFGLVFVIYMLINSGLESIYAILWVGLPLIFVGILYMIQYLKMRFNP